MLRLLATLGALARFGPRSGSSEDLREAGIVLVQQPMASENISTRRPATNRIHRTFPHDPCCKHSRNWTTHRRLQDPSGAGTPSQQHPLSRRPLNLHCLAWQSASSGGAEGAAGGGTRGEPGGTTRLSVFGVTGEGKTFVFVFDRSGSMAGYGGAPLAGGQGRAGAGHRTAGPGFTSSRSSSITNGRWSSDPTRVTRDWYRATTRASNWPGRFIDDVTANGGTQHLDALKLALNMAPDVIFFLTDADEPRLSDADLRRIRGWNRHSVIHAIEFGHGRPSDRKNFLVRLAEQNGGQHAYVDVSRLQTKRAEK